jgi:hypothetical protein
LAAAPHPKTTHAVDRAVHRLLAMPPSDFVALLRRLNLL